MRSGYAKFETFPIWNLPLKHEVNMAYEAATAELRDVNLVDHFHLEAHGERTVNYNRDLEAFPLVRRILEKITGGPSFYQSPTDMGVNRAGFGITDDLAVRAAARQEIIRRYFRYACEHAMGLVDEESVHRIELLMNELGLKPEDRPVVALARQAAQIQRERGKGSDGIFCGAAIEFRDGSTAIGGNSRMLHAASRLILNATKKLAGFPDKFHLLPDNITDSVRHLKTEVLGGKRVSMDVDETLIALAISATTNPAAQLAMEKLPLLKNCEVHLTHMPTPGDEAGLRKLGVNVTSDPDFATKNLFVS
jgi:uncharacterized protein (UPF0371 family)